MTPFFSYQHAIRKSNLEPTTKLVLYTIATYMALDGTGCFPSYSTIADSCGLGRSTAIAHVKKAVEAGFLAKATRRDDDGEHTSNLYQAMMPEGSPLAGPPSPAAGPRVVQQRDPKYPFDLPNEQTPKSPKGAEPVSGFDEFWDAYPRKVGKPNALKAWKRLKPDISTVLAALKRQKASEQWTKDDGQFIPHPTTWLNREGWQDAVAGEKPVVSTEELEARRRKAEQGKSLYEESIRRGQEERMRQMGIKV